MRSCSGVKRIYLLIRPRPDMTLQQRVKQQIFKTPVFEPLFQERPDLNDFIQERIVPIEGDLVLSGLGIKPEDRKRLIEEV
jgi:fatty acyl-CoA reductase